MKEKIIDLTGGGLISILSAVITKSWQTTVALIVLWCVLMLVNVVLGVLAAKQSDTYDPAVGRKGFYKKCGAAMLIIAFVILDWAILVLAPMAGFDYEFPWISSAIIGYLIVHELTSIIDNSKKLGNEIPSFVDGGISRVSDAIDKGAVPGTVDAPKITK